jgi:DnaK suppressor protein
MNQKQRRDGILNLRQVLVKRRDALRRALAGDMSLLKEFRTLPPGDTVDSALESGRDEISSQLIEVEGRELSRIEYALERMREGSFGICEGCGTNIPMARLNALPYATRCIACQRESERQLVGSSDAVDFGRLLDSSSGDIELSIDDFDQNN